MANIGRNDVSSMSMAAEIRAHIEKALTPGRTMTELANAFQEMPSLPKLGEMAKVIQSQQHAALISEIAKAMRPPTHLTVVSQIMSAMQREHLSIATLARPPEIFNDMAKQIGQMRSLCDSIIAPHKVFQDQMHRQLTMFEEMKSRSSIMDAFKFDMPQLSHTMLAWNVASIGLANRMKDVGLLARHEELSVRLLSAPSAFATFVRHTSDRLSTASNPGITARLRSSLSLAEHQLLGIADGISAFVAVPEDDEAPEGKRNLNAPFLQQDELISGEPPFGESDTLALAAPSFTTRAVEHSRRVLELITQCNEAGKTSQHGVEFFKPTTRMLTVFSDLPWVSATDKSKFCEVLDCLYFIFYEGAGKDNLRFLDKHGGPLTDSDCDLIWCIKHLRNKWSRHDADHGNDREIKRSWHELAARFSWLGLSEHPTNAQHFQQLQCKLLELAMDFLLCILNKLSLKQ